MKRSHWIVLLALVALTMPLVGASLVGLSAAIFSPAEPLPTLMAPVTLAAGSPGASYTATAVPPTATPLGLAQASLEPPPSPETAENSPATETSAIETPVEPPTASPELIDTPVPEMPTGVAGELAPTLEPAATAAPAVPTATSSPTETPLPTATPSPTSTPTLVVALNVPASYIIPATAHAGQIFLQGKNLGNRPGVFALVGDSNTDNPNFFAPLDNGNYTLGEYAYLQETVTFFRGSFAQHSPAAVGSFNTSKVLDPAYADRARCLGNESPLACEYRLQRPSVALILIGTGDHLDWANFEGRYRRILDYTLAQGIVPVLLTKADDLESKEQGAPYDFTNNVIRRLGRDYDLPLLDLRRVVELLPNRGCVADGFHYNTPPDGRSADFTGYHLNYGYNVRNLTGLLVLDELRRQVLQP